MSEGSPESIGEAAPADASIARWPRRPATLEAVVRAVDRKVAARRQRRRRAGMAALTLLVVIGGWWGFTPARVPDTSASAAVVLVPARQVLPDGSVVELNDGAAISADYTAEVRRVVLTRGEAHFDVVSDPARPFVVLAHGVEVRAVGTAFAVQLGRERVEVLVTEGRVAVEARSARLQAGTEGTEAPSISSTLVEAGRGAVVTLATSASGPATTEVTDVPDAFLGARLAWRHPRLEFLGTPLAEAIQLFNQRAPMRLVLADAPLGNVRISGVLRADNISALLTLLAADHGIVAEEAGPGVLRLRKRE